MKQEENLAANSSCKLTPEALIDLINNSPFDLYEPDEDHRVVVGEDADCEVILEVLHGDGDVSTLLEHKELTESLIEVKEFKGKARIVITPYPYNEYIPVELVVREQVDMDRVLGLCVGI